MACASFFYFRFLFFHFLFFVAIVGIVDYLIDKGNGEKIEENFDTPAAGDFGRMQQKSRKNRRKRKSRKNG